MDLHGRAAVVTGGGTGIGAATAHALVEAGVDRIALTWSRSEDDVRRVGAALEAAGARVLLQRVDVRDDGQVRALADAVAAELGGCDVLVNNAGATAWVPPADLEALADDVLHDVLDVNLVGAFRVVRALRDALAEGDGVVVNVASISAHRGIGSSIAYAVSKAGLVQLTRSLATALAPAVRVVSVSPGTVDTRWQRDHHGDDGFEQLTEAEREASPLARTAQPEDVADAVLGLLRADMVTGVDVVVDGGRHVTY